MSTLLTVGYGDIYPVTTLGRIMAICIAYLGVGAVAIPTGIISAGFVEQYQRKSSISDIKNADIREIAEIKIDKTQAGKTVEEIEETDFVSIYLIFRDDLSILPQKDTMLKLNDIIIIRDGNQEYFLNILLCVPIYKIWISTEGIIYPGAIARKGR